MTRITFYLGGGNGTGNRELLACRVAEKAWRAGHHVYIHTDSAATTSALDDLLWTFRDGAFVPHAVDSGKADPSPVLIGHDSDNPGGSRHDVMINLTDAVPASFGRFERLAEVVGNDENQRQLARERFRFYRDRGYALETHDLEKR